MNKLQIFKNPEFGQVRTLIKDGQPWFVAKDVAEILGYVNPRDAISKHVDTEDKGVANCDTLGGKQELTIINESGLYALVFGSRLEMAKRFKRWVTSEVLPALRKTGAYIMPQSKGLEFLQGLLDEMKRQAAEIQEVKTTAKAIKDAIVEEYDEWREEIRHKVSAIQKATGETYANTWNRLYDELEKRARCDLSVRVNNGRFRLQEAGATKKVIEAFGRLDVIEQDPRLKEIFIAIVKEYTVKYVA